MTVGDKLRSYNDLELAVAIATLVQSFIKGMTGGSVILDTEKLSVDFCGVFSQEWTEDEDA